MTVLSSLESPLADSEGTSEVPSSARSALNLTPPEHPWPTCFSAAVSKVLGDADIPNFMWGDLLNSWHGHPHIPNVCGFVVPSASLDSAVDAITRAGLPACPCTEPHHLADPSSGTALPVHFVVRQPYSTVFLFLCPSDILLDIVPLTASHSNPASLSYDRLRVSLCDAYASARADTDASPDLVGDTYALNTLTASSLVKALLLLDALSPPVRVGVGAMYAYVLHIVTVTAPGPYDLQSPSLQNLWERVFMAGDRTPETRELLLEDVRAEWRERVPAGWFGSD